MIAGHTKHKQLKATDRRREYIFYIFFIARPLLNGVFMELNNVKKQPIVQRQCDFQCFALVRRDKGKSSSMLKAVAGLESLEWGVINTEWMLFNFWAVLHMIERKKYGQALLVTKIKSATKWSSLIMCSFCYLYSSNRMVNISGDYTVAAHFASVNATVTEFG